jgi:hypothetical protein
MSDALAPYFDMCPCGRWCLVIRPIPLEEGGFVPPGFKSDGFSCPRIAWPLIRPRKSESDPHFGVYGVGGIKHDYRYFSKCSTQATADAYLLKDMMAIIGDSAPGRRIEVARARVRAVTAYSVLRAVGWYHYGKRTVNGCDNPCGAFPTCVQKQNALEHPPL